MLSGWTRRHSYGNQKYFEYGDKEITYLAAKDKKLGAAMEQIGHIKREVTPDLFAMLVRSIVGQQISTKAQHTIWGRMVAGIGAITPEAVAALPAEQLQSFGISFRKAGYIKNAAEKILSGHLDIEALQHKTDDEVCRELSALEGIGVWTAEMLMTFSMQRPDIISFGDLAILRGLRMLYHHRKITRELFDKYRRRYSPYATVASLYLWAIAGGAIPELRDRAPKGGK